MILLDLLGLQMFNMYNMYIMYTEIKKMLKSQDQITSSRQLYRQSSHTPAFQRAFRSKCSHGMVTGHWWLANGDWPNVFRMQYWSRMAALVTGLCVVVQTWPTYPTWFSDFSDLIGCKTFTNFTMHRKIICEKSLWYLLNHQCTQICTNPATAK